MLQGWTEIITLHSWYFFVLAGVIKQFFFPGCEQIDSSQVEGIHQWLDRKSKVTEPFRESLFNNLKPRHPSIVNQQEHSENIWYFSLHFAPGRKINSSEEKMSVITKKNKKKHQTGVIVDRALKWTVWKVLLTSSKEIHLVQSWGGVANEDSDDEAHRSNYIHGEGVTLNEIGAIAEIFQLDWLSIKLQPVEEMTLAPPLTSTMNLRDYSQGNWSAENIYDF